MNLNLPPAAPPLSSGLLHSGTTKQRKFGFGLAAFLGVGFYIGSSLIVLNFSETAYPHDEEYFGPRQVSFGPRPRHPFCRPSYPSGYDGHEWALVFYRPICQLWACWKGYAPPFSWR